MRFAVLEDIEAEASAEIAKLEIRNRELAKVLGRPKLELK
jgi:hypothetical protein